MGNWVECRLIKPLLSAFLEGSLNRKMNRMVDNHLASCAECRSQLRPLDRLAWDLYEDRSGRPPWTASREFVVRLEGALHEEIGRFVSLGADRSAHLLSAAGALGYSERNGRS